MNSLLTSEGGSTTLTMTVFHAIQLILEDLGIVTSSDNEPLQLLDLPLRLLLPNLQTVDLPSMMIEATVHFLKVPLNNFGPFLH